MIFAWQSLRVEKDRDVIPSFRHCGPHTENDGENVSCCVFTVDYRLLDVGKHSSVPYVVCSCEAHTHKEEREREMEPKLHISPQQCSSESTDPQQCSIDSSLTTAMHLKENKNKRVLKEQKK